MSVCRNCSQQLYVRVYYINLLVFLYFNFVNYISNFKTLLLHIGAWKSVHSNEHLFVPTY